MKNILRFYKYLGPYWMECLLASVIMFFGVLTSVLYPYMYQKIIDEGFQSDAIIVLVKNIIILIVLLLINELLNLLQKIVSSSINRKVFLNLRFDVYKHLHNLSMGFYTKKHSGEIMSNMFNDIASTQNILIENFFTLIKDINIIIGILIFLFVMSWKLMLLSLLILPLFILVFYGFKNKVYNVSKQVHQNNAELMEGFQEDIIGMQIIQGYNASETKLKQAYQNIDENEKIKRKLAIRTSKASFSAVFITVLGIMMLWGGGGYQVKIGSLTIGALIAITYYYNNLTGLLVQVFNISIAIRAAIPAVERIFNVINTLPDIKNHDEAVDICSMDQGIRFEEVTFSYDKTRMILHNSNMIINKNSIVGIIGDSGEGKTTLINLIARFYDVDKGEILIDNTNIKHIELKKLRKKIVVVPQENFLFNTTIKDNITMGRSHISVEEIISICKIAKAHNFIMKLPKGYHTVVNEKGNLLSGGQKRRIALARALLLNPWILILDEPTSDIDKATEEKILTSLKHWAKDKIVIIVTHKESTLKYCNKVVEIKEGNVYQTNHLSKNKIEIC